MAQKSSTLHIHRDVYEHLENMFEKGSAMHKIRRHFTTLAYLSCKAGSTTIPPYLTHFVEKLADEIISNDHYRLNDWEHAVGKLKNLAPTTEALDQLAHGRNRRANHVTHCHRPYNYCGESDDEEDAPNWWNRGRRLGRADGRHRSRTMPPIYYPPVPRIGAPNYLALPASRGIMSGFPSPALFAQETFREAEMDDMRGQMMFLEDQVNQLAVGQQALEEDVHEVQVQADPFGPRLLAYH
ncbi:uncharacterized protein N0V89_005947 [Didymosphaeria variabile]|uniref:Uncharacterized protein n=1 Tax=Didymosphaeria variabile TaxID=1932322 RepID=A0A9W8XNV4_9PLEO|nr:uncharacterized protein N0V89_005947 [Didymosphaeria variabile]KAJ4354213.1 hypothetical protein N0V89_005947 [Didymosphaeria variabile]